MQFLVFAFLNLYLSFLTFGNGITVADERDGGNKVNKLLRSESHHVAVDAAGVSSLALLNSTVRFYGASFLHFRNAPCFMASDGSAIYFYTADQRGQNGHDSPSTLGYYGNGQYNFITGTLMFQINYKAGTATADSTAPFFQIQSVRNPTNCLVVSGNSMNNLGVMTNAGQLGMGVCSSVPTHWSFVAVGNTWSSGNLAGTIGVEDGLLAWQTGTVGSCLQYSSCSGGGVTMAKCNTGSSAQLVDMTMFSGRLPNSVPPQVPNTAARPENGAGYPQGMYIPPR